MDMGGLLERNEGGVHSGRGDAAPRHPNGGGVEASVEKGVELDGAAAAEESRGHQSSDRASQGKCPAK